MDHPAILLVAAALIGSLIGGVSTFAASWLTQRGHYRTENLMRQSARLESQEFRDPLQKFSTACRAELRRLRG